MNFKNNIKTMISALLSASMLLSTVPIISYAAQSNEYVDPADVWISSVGRTNELDMNATITYETAHCGVCNKDTTVMTYRVPEYTRTGETALNRGVYYSDGTLIDGEGHGNLDDGTPGVDAFYTGCHWTKNVCQNCGTINVLDGLNAYNYNRNVYSLNSCDTTFFLPFDSTTYTPYNNEQHLVTAKAGKYCQFCKGTKEVAHNSYESHDFDETVDGEIGNQRFHITGECEDCGYIKNEYAAAKSVVQSYYGKVDGQAHTISVFDLSENGVNTSIRYGTSASSCTLTSAPNYTDEGYYPVYYAITYSYDGESMTENGVSYVWLLADSTTEVASNSNDVHVHDYRYLETVSPTCTELGYERWQCSECGALQKTNYTPATGHSYNTIVIREASCQQGGLELHMCSSCGSYYTASTSMTDHTYQTTVIPATCTTNGYTEHTCVNCGYKYITDLTALKKHDYREKVIAPGCTTRGYTTYTCADCGTSYISDYTDAAGHEWDSGHTITNSTCNSEGVIEYNCKHCDEKMIQAISATGHTPGAEATCTEPQTCEKCGAVLELPKGHHYSESVTSPTCWAMGYTTHTCDDCGISYVGDYTDKTEHHYHSVITPPTCTALGYTTYTCTDCGDEYKSDYVDKTDHDYIAVVTPATCTSMGFTTYTCADCNDSHVADYTDVLEHNYSKHVVEPTCTEQGYTVYTCPDCGKEYIGDEKESVEHHYSSVITAPKCEEMGYTTYTCEDCGYSYIADYTNPTGHSYNEEVTPPTCTEIGFSTFTCKACGKSYIGNETAKLAHKYAKTVTAPTCTELGYTTYVCEDCGDEVKSDYIEPIGHTLSDWIIDTPATIEHSGAKHIECTVCGTILVSAEIDQLIDKDNSNEDGQSKVGDYSILITDKDNKPVFNSEISIDKNDNITIKLPDGRLLSADDITTITVTRTETQTPMQGIKIFIADHMNNAATGQTDANGQLKVPNSQSSTGDTTGTITDNETTFVVIATDKTGTLIPNCDAEVGDNFSINVKLPIGTAFDADNRVTITVVTELGEPVKNLRVQILGDGDHIENGYTNIKGQITLPMSNTDITDDKGNGEVGDISGDKIYDYIVTVSDEIGLVENALITLVTEDEAVLVCLPEGKTIDYYNRTTVKVVRADGTPVPDWKVTVYNKDGSGIRTELTDENGIIIVPPLSEAPISKPTPTPEPDEDTPLPGVTPSPKPSDNPDDSGETETPTPTNPDSTEKPSEPGEDDITATPTPVPDLGDGSVVQNKNYKYRVYVWDNGGIITEFGLIKLQEDGSLVIELPENKPLDENNKTYVKVINDSDNTASAHFASQKSAFGSPHIFAVPVKAITVNVSDVNGVTASDITNSYGIAVVPVSDSDITDIKGNAQVKDKDGKLYNINVSTDEKGAIEGATIKVKDGKIFAVLPDGTTINYKDRTTVLVSDRDNIPVTDIPVNVRDNNGGDRTENTDRNGAAVVPPRNEYETDDKGDTGEIVIPVPTPEPTPTPDPDATPEPEITPDPDATPTPVPTPTPKPITQMNVKVEDESGVIEGAIVTIGENNEIGIALPNGKMLNKDNRISVTVTDQDNEPVSDLLVTVTDYKGNTASDTTNKSGIVIVPVTDTDSSDDKGGIIKDDTAQYTVTVENNDGIVKDAVVTIKDGKISVKLPDTHTLTTSNQTKVTVVDKDAQPVKGVSVTVTDKNNTTATQTTNTSGQITVPVKTSSSGGSSGGGGGGGSSSTSYSYAIKVVDKDGKTVSVSKSTDKDGNLTLTLPNGNTLDDNNYTISVTKSNKAVSDVAVTLKDKDGNSVEGTTDSNGQVVLPALVTPIEHSAYIVGYPDGRFDFDGNMNRAEAAAIFARLIADAKGEKISGSASFKDVRSDAWYYSYISYLEKYDILKGYTDKTFRPDAPVTRAEFVAISVRYYKLFNTIEDVANTTKYSDVDSNYWAVKDISVAKSIGWLNGYADGTFRGDNNITRAEAVTVVNRATGRKADTEYVNKNFTKLNRFTDITDNSQWFFMDVMEAANDHMAITESDNETWEK